MIDSFIPDALNTYLEGQEYSLINFNFIPLEKVPSVSLSTGWLDFDQENEVLENLGIESGSTFINNMSLFFTFLMIGGGHLWLLYLWRCRKNEHTSKCKKFLISVKEKILDILKYALYLRLFMEAHENLLLSWVSELYHFSPDSFGRIVSFLIALEIFMISLILPILAFYAFYITQNGKKEEKFLLMEFLSDLRDARRARIYMTWMTVRRILFIVVILFMINTPRTLIYTLLISKFLPNP